MGTIRTVIVTISPREGSIIQELISGYANVERVGDFDNRTDAENGLADMVPDIILVGLHKGETDNTARKLLDIVPLSKVIAFSPDFCTAYVHELRAHRTELPNLSPKALIDAVIGATNFRSPNPPYIRVLSKPANRKEKDPPTAAAGPEFE